MDGKKDEPTWLMEFDFADLCFINRALQQYAEWGGMPRVDALIRRFDALIKPERERGLCELVALTEELGGYDDE